MAAREVRIYSRSMIFYWWPVWVVGYLLAAVTYFFGQPVTLTSTATGVEVDRMVYIHPNGSLGVIFTFTLVLVVIMTHFAVRGVASLTVIVTAIAATLFLAYVGWWNTILSAVAGLAIYMNLSFYLFFSTAMFVVWFLAVFVFVRLDYYRFKPGQMVHVTVFGGGEETFDTRGMAVTKMRDDLFRHWILGLGSGDMHIIATGARAADFTIPNVLFVGTKLQQIQTLIAMRPDETPDKVFTAGQPG